VRRRVVRQQRGDLPDGAIVRLRRPDLLHLLCDDVHDVHDADLLDHLDDTLTALEPGAAR